MCFSLLGALPFSIAWAQARGWEGEGDEDTARARLSRAWSCWSSLELLELLGAAGAPWSLACVCRARVPCRWGSVLDTGHLGDTIHGPPWVRWCMGAVLLRLQCSGAVRGVCVCVCGVRAGRVCGVCVCGSSVSVSVCGRACALRVLTA
jgi:hypothetical protein